MSRVHLTPDGLVIVARDADPEAEPALTYTAERADFETDFATVLDAEDPDPGLDPAFPLPEGARERFYAPPTSSSPRHVVTYPPLSAHPQPPAWPWGDAVLDRVAALTDAQAARTAPPPPTLAEARAAASATIDAHAETVRGAFITPGSGQAMTYQAKAQELATYDVVVAAEVTPDPADYPLAMSEVAAGIAGDLAAAMANIRAARAAWTQAAAAIDAARLGGKAAVAVESDIAGVATARDAALAQLDAIAGLAP